MTDTTNTDLQHNVLAELEWEPSVNASEIGITAEDGVVTLTGYVESYAEKLASAQAAQRVVGVQAVANDIHVRIPFDSTRTDAELAQAALDSLAWHASVPRNAISLTVNDGHIHLDGEVPWQFQRLAAEGAVRNLRGVTGVSNAITVQPHPMPLDTYDNASQEHDIRSRIENAFRRSAEVDAHHIQVDSIEGHVTLYGTVHSWGEREQAERAAWAAPGVSSVSNAIAVIR